MVVGVESMFSRGQVPWHGLGKIIDNDKALSIEEGIVDAGANWEVEKVPLFLQDGTEVEQNAIRRMDTGDILGYVSPSYQPLQNLEAFQFFQPFLDAKQAKLETAGVLFNGRRTWVLASLDLNDMEIVPGDFIKKFILLSSSHDGTKSVTLGFTPIRVVCYNTLSAALSNRRSELTKVRHTQSIKTKLEEVRNTMNLAKQKFDKAEEAYKFLAGKSPSKEQLLEYFVKVLTIPVNDKGEISTRSTNTIGSIATLIEKGLGADIKGVRGTWYGVMNATAEYLSYQASRTTDRRMDNVWFNTATLDRSLTEALRLASV